MWVYTVLHTFRDLQDNGHIYHEGDTYPRDGVSVTPERKNELKSENNKIGKPLIKAVQVKKK